MCWEGPGAQGRFYSKGTLPLVQTRNLRGSQAAPWVRPKAGEAFPVRPTLTQHFLRPATALSALHPLLQPQQPQQPPQTGHHGSPSTGREAEAQGGEPTCLIPHSRSVEAPKCESHGVASSPRLLNQENLAWTKRVGETGGSQ